MEVVGALTVQDWLVGDGYKNDSKENSKTRILSKRGIAYPVHAEGGRNGAAHWTLAVLVNKNWKSSEPEPSWDLFHFDSARCNSGSKINAEKIAQIILETDFIFVEVPVPSQPAGSNDCGLYPAHHLRTFLMDVEGSIK